MSYKIKFGTDGWREIIARDYTVENLRRVAAATAEWMLQNDMQKAVVGFDCRFGGRMFAEATAEVLASYGCSVILDTDFVSTPMVSLAVLKENADMGIVITASHNPPEYNGFKLKSAYGGPTIPAEIAEIEAMIPDQLDREFLPITEYEKRGNITYQNLEKLYLDQVDENFDMDTIRTAGIRLAYDAMYGAGQNVIRKLFPDAELLHCDLNPGFHGQAPEPIPRNLSDLAATVSERADIDLGLANDGDADRIGLFDEHGNFVDSHHILLLLLMYMVEHKKETGKVVATFSVTNKMEQLADQYGLDFHVTPVGFKYIAEIMTQEKVVVGGEESGGLAVQSHIPERDGIWVGLLIMEFMAKTGKTLSELIGDVYDKVGSFSYDRDDLKVSDAIKKKVIAHCEAQPFESFGPYEVSKFEDMDGFKFTIDQNTWTMIRPSGTEAVLRVYGQASNATEVRKLLDAVGAEIERVGSE